MSEKKSFASKTDQIKKIAEHWRVILEKEHEKLDIQFKWFPQAACSAASTILFWALRHEGFDARIVTVCSESRYFSHAWVIVEDLHIDITGDQFSASDPLYPPPVYVSTQLPEWSRGLPPKPYSEDDNADANIRDNYNQLIEKYGRIKFYHPVVE
ncbi:hypothetical protein [Deinococcus sp. Leaf326]|uniref:hypothetical protein n=1 Tax=Deinococcus sp. Leaf326 TaxID=1736338 RepID=UPI000B10ADD4|nr:hypothetical protein [Deinococcus sp. Leaf326]